MNDELTTLALSMQRKKGSFALLLGSGVSQASGIPTGWAILLDLIQKIAIAMNESVTPTPVEWYKQKFNKEPTYSDLLERVGSVPADRSLTIADYIEPQGEERELGLKQPTDAHRSIASLVATGYIRVIITTNFDRLLETALVEVGVTPSVISSSDNVLGTLPLVHNACTIIKIHGDYQDARIRNTTNELSDYDDSLSELLRQVFREYGLVISGWSAEWDTALSTLLKDERSPWFSTYWIAYSEPKAAAKVIIESRRASLIAHMGAEEFFSTLAEAVQALNDHENAETLSLTIAESSLKRYLDDPTKRIRAYDLIVGEATRVASWIRSVDLHQTISSETLTAQMEAYERTTEVIRTLFVVGCYWGKEEHKRNWIDALERLSNFDVVLSNHYTEWLDLRYYPALQLLYSGGVAALANNQLSTLKSLLYDPVVSDPKHPRSEPLIGLVHCSILAPGISKNMNNITSSVILPWRMRSNDSWFWQTLKNYIPSEERRRDLFLRFEYIFGLTHTDIQLQDKWGNVWVPRGSFNRGYDDQYLETIRNEIDSQGESWPFLEAGFFGGSLERLTKAKEQYDLTFQRR